MFYIYLRVLHAHWNILFYFLKNHSHILMKCVLLLDTAQSLKTCKLLGAAPSFLLLLWFLWGFVFLSQLSKDGVSLRRVQCYLMLKLNYFMVVAGCLQILNIAFFPSSFKIFLWAHSATLGLLGITALLENHV